MHRRPISDLVIPLPLFLGTVVMGAFAILSPPEFRWFPALCGVIYTIGWSGILVDWWLDQT